MKDPIKVLFGSATQPPSQPFEIAARPSGHRVAGLINLPMLLRPGLHGVALPKCGANDSHSRCSWWDPSFRLPSVRRSHWTASGGAKGTVTYSGYRDGICASSK